MYKGILKSERPATLKDNLTSVFLFHYTLHSISVKNSKNPIFTSKVLYFACVLPTPPSWLIGDRVKPTDNYDGLIFFAVGLKRLSIIICAEQNSPEEPAACEKTSNPEKRSTFRAWMLSGKCGRQLRYPFFEERFVGFLAPPSMLQIPDMPITAYRAFYCTMYFVTKMKDLLHKNGIF